MDENMRLKYETIAKVGKGAYGVVWRAIEKSTKKMVAIKKIYDAFTNDTDAQRTFREIFLLMEMGNHPNIVKIQNLRKA
jgi:mitogen-activated protein kinase 15